MCWLRRNDPVWFVARRLRSPPELLNFDQNRWLRPINPQYMSNDLVIRNTPEQSLRMRNARSWQAVGFDAEG